MGICKDCKHWYGMIACSLPDWLDQYEHPPKDGFGIHIRADDDQGLDFQFRTGPDFGCIRFEQK